MNENRENTMNNAAANTGDTAAARMEARENEALNALLEGFADEGDDVLEASEEDDAFGTDEEDDAFGAGPDDDDDVLILVGAPEDGAPAAADASGRAKQDGADGANGKAGKNAAVGTAAGKNGASVAGAGSTEKNADAPTDSAPGKNAAVTADGAAETSEKTTAEAAQRFGEEPRYKVQISGREQEMSVSELIAAAQRGLQHDAMSAELNAAQQALPALRMVEQYAAANGMTAGQYLQVAGQNIHRQAVEQLTQKGVPEETARELVNERVRMEAEKRAIAPLVQQMKAEEARKKAREPWLEMTRQYPDVTNLPDSVLESVQRGETPLAAMRAWELEQLRAKLSAQELQLSAQAATLKNRRTAPGSAAGAGDTRRDPFLEALFADD